MAASLPSPPAEPTDTAPMALDEQLDGAASPSSSIASDDIDGDYETTQPSNAPIAATGGGTEPSNAGPSRSTRQSNWNGGGGGNSNSRRQQRGRKGDGGGGKASWRGAGGLLGPGGMDGGGPQEKLLDMDYARSASPAVLSAR